MLEHPAITRILATGVNEPLHRAAKICQSCGGGLYPGDGYYRVAGEVYCESCMKSYREEVEL